MSNEFGPPIWVLRLWAHGHAYEVIFDDLDKAAGALVDWRRALEKPKLRNAVSTWFGMNKVWQETNTMIQMRDAFGTVHVLAANNFEAACLFEQEALIKGHDKVGKRAKVISEYLVGRNTFGFAPSRITPPDGSKVN